MDYEPGQTASLTGTRPTPRPPSSTGQHQFRVRTDILVSPYTYRTQELAPARRWPRPVTGPGPGPPAIFPPHGVYHSGTARDPAPGSPSFRLGDRHHWVPRAPSMTSGFLPGAGTPFPPAVSALREEATAPLPLWTAERGDRSTAAGTGPDTPQRRPLPPGRGVVGTHRSPIVLRSGETALRPAQSSLPLPPPPSKWSLPELHSAPFGKSHPWETGGASGPGRFPPRGGVSR
ncbi:MAPK-interacting and spindle-stabilizing protein-like [Lathamus discolor]|uniref:MAPK-interacting and spindle-stabilizing protein-like n=1 Tax=Lathamus discolor TaxID=678569 RepID=UPI0032B727CB